MSRRKTERLLNLVICLLATGHYLTAEQIRHAVPGYPEGDEAFKRMFERDKEELRELGIPLETGMSADDEAGYRIPRQAYELPDLHLTPDEAAVLGLAARVWQRASLAEAASGALLKLRAAGIETDAIGRSPGIMGIEPRVDTDDPAFPVLWQAGRDRRPVAFDYQGVGRSAPQHRHLEPWGVVSRRGRWYVVGHDRDRDGVRVFRLSRIIGEVVPAGAAGRAAGGHRAAAHRPRARPAPLGPCGDLVRPGLGQRRADLHRGRLVRALPCQVRRRRRRARPAGPARGRDPPAQGRTHMTSTSTDRLARLLALVPYVVSRRSVGLAEAAA